MVGLTWWWLVFEMSGCELVGLLVLGIVIFWFIVGCVLCVCMLGVLFGV